MKNQSPIEIPQGSILGPLLWIGMYSRVKTLDLLTDVTSIDFADYIAVVVAAYLLEEVEIYTNKTSHEVISWLDKYLILSAHL